MYLFFNCREKNCCCYRGKAAFQSHPHASNPHLRQEGSRLGISQDSNQQHSFPLFSNKATTRCNKRSTFQSNLDKQTQSNAVQPGKSYYMLSETKLQRYDRETTLMQITLTRGDLISLTIRNQGKPLHLGTRDVPKSLQLHTSLSATLEDSRSVGKTDTVSFSHL